MVIVVESKWTTLIINKKFSIYIQVLEGFSWLKVPLSALLLIQGEGSACVGWIHTHSDLVVL